MDRFDRQPHTRNEIEQESGANRVVRKGRQRPSRVLPYARSKSSKPVQYLSKLKKYVLQTIPWFWTKQKSDDNGFPSGPHESPTEPLANHGLPRGTTTTSLQPGSNLTNFVSVEGNRHGDEIGVPEIVYRTDSNATVFDGLEEDRSLAGRSTAQTKPRREIPAPSLPPPSSSHTIQPVHVTVSGPKEEARSFSSSSLVGGGGSGGFGSNVRLSAERHAWREAFEQLEKGRRFDKEEVDFLIEVVRRNSQENLLSTEPSSRYPSRYPTIENKSQHPLPSPAPPIITPGVEEGRSKYNLSYAPTPHTRPSLWGGAVPMSIVSTHPQSSLSPIHGAGISGIASSSPMMNGIVSSSTSRTLFVSPTSTSSRLPYQDPSVSLATIFGDSRPTQAVGGSSSRGSSGGANDLKLNGPEPIHTDSPLKLTFGSAGSPPSPIQTVYQPPMRTFETSDISSSSEAAKNVLRTLTHLGTPLMDSKRLKALPAPVPRFRITSPPPFDSSSSASSSTYSSSSSVSSTGIATQPGSDDTQPEPWKATKPAVKPRPLLQAEKKALTAKLQVTKPPLRKPLERKPLTKLLSTKPAAPLKKKEVEILPTSSSEVTEYDKKIENEPADKPTPFAGFNFVAPEPIDESKITRGKLPVDIVKSTKPSTLNWDTDTTSRKETSTSGKINKKRQHSSRGEMPAKKRGVTSNDSDVTTQVPVDIATEESSTTAFGADIGRGTSGGTESNWKFGADDNFSFGDDSSTTTKPSLTVTFDNNNAGNTKKVKLGASKDNWDSTETTYGMGFGNPGAGFNTDNTSESFFNKESSDFGTSGGFGTSFQSDKAKPDTTSQECPVCHNNLEDMDHSDCQAELKTKQSEDTNSTKLSDLSKPLGTKTTEEEPGWSFGGSNSISTIPEEAEGISGDSTTKASHFEIPAPKKPTQTAAKTSLNSKLGVTKPIITKPLTKKAPLVRKTAPTLLTKPGTKPTITTNLKPKTGPGIKEKGDIKSLIKQATEQKKKEDGKKLLTVTPEKVAPSSSSSAFSSSLSEGSGFNFGSTTEPTGFAFKSSTTSNSGSLSNGGSKTCKVCHNDLEDMDHSSCQEESEDKSKETSSGFNWGATQTSTTDLTSGFGSESTEKSDFAFGGGFGSTATNGDSAGFKWGGADDATNAFGSTTTTKPSKPGVEPGKKDKPSSSIPDPLKPDFSFGNTATETAFGSSSDIFGGTGGSSKPTSDFTFGESGSGSLTDTSSAGGFSFGGGGVTPAPGFEASSTSNNKKNEFKPPAFGSSASGGLGADSGLFAFGDTGSSNNNFSFGGADSGSNKSSGGFGGGNFGGASDFVSGGFGNTPSFGSTSSFESSNNNFSFGENSSSNTSFGAFGSSGGPASGSFGGGGFGSSSGPAGDFNFGDDGGGGGFNVGKRKMVKVRRKGAKR